MAPSMTVFLSGHIHGGWRDHVRELAEDKALDITFKGPCEDHGLSDDIGVKIRGIAKEDVGEDFVEGVRPFGKD